MPNNSKFEIPEPKQDRSKKNLENILEAAHKIVEGADPEMFTSRVLAKKSGYSLGTLSRRLSSIENVFFWAIKRGREMKFQQLANNFSRFDPKLTVEDFVNTMVDQSFAGIGHVSPRVMRYYDDRFTRKNGLPADYFDYIDVLVEPYLEICRKDQTNTFRKIARDEGWLLFRTILTLLERPFAQHDPMAGTTEHRRIAVETCIRILGK